MTAALAAIAEDVHNNEPLTITDIKFSNWLHVHHVRWLTTALWLITSTHSSTVISIVAFPIGLYLWRRRERFWLAVLWISVYGGNILNKLLKFAFHRTRPKFTDTVQTLTSYSFPSGHTMAATVFYGALAMFLISKRPHWPSRIVAAAIALLMIVLVALSRVYLGAHYLSDVLA
ncbi:MAG TPA: phosphatase PAP2 family protein, partial [Pyrinomonadaceae bacterium]|nr:phosphatase PAP2 family protein [Pyrinomonadaceae bacterium]